MPTPCRKPVVTSADGTIRPRARRGQSLVEFALVLPMLHRPAPRRRRLRPRLRRPASRSRRRRATLRRSCAQEYLRNPPGAPRSERVRLRVADLTPALLRERSTTLPRVLHAVKSRVSRTRRTRPDDPGTPVRTMPIAGRRGDSPMPLITTCACTTTRIPSAVDVAFGATIPSGVLASCARRPRPTHGGQAPSDEPVRRGADLLPVHDARQPIEDLQLPFGWDHRVGDVWLQRRIEHFTVADRIRRRSDASPPPPSDLPTAADGRADRSPSTDRRPSVSRHRRQPEPTMGPAALQRRTRSADRPTPVP